MTIPRNVFITRREFIGRKIEELTERGLKQLAKARYIGKKVDDTIARVSTMDDRINKQAQIMYRAQHILSQPATILRPDIQIAMAARIVAASTKSVFFGLQKIYWQNRRERLSKLQEQRMAKTHQIMGDIQLLRNELNR